jgi:hypothetical protein
MFSKAGHWISYKWFSFILWAFPSRAERFHERKGMRRAIGGRWGLWEVDMGGWMGKFHIWLRSQCEHYPSPPFATSTEPLETEEYK